MKLHGDHRVFLRVAVYQKYLKARKLVADAGYELVVYDGWRSVELQENLFWYYLREFTSDRYGLASEFAHCTSSSMIREVFLQLPATMQETLRAANRTYVSWPSKDIHSPSPHATGGAIDVWLHKDGKPVNLGVPFDWMEEDAGAFYHLKRKRRYFPGDATICARRSLILLSMWNAGFSCYGPEIWHFNCGNQMDALVTGGDARYSYIEP
jgi:D-alanyl-D-alanine dipeptidase